VKITKARGERQQSEESRLDEGKCQSKVKVKFAMKTMRDSAVVTPLFSPLCGAFDFRFGPEMRQLCKHRKTFNYSLKAQPNEETKYT